MTIVYVQLEITDEAFTALTTTQWAELHAHMPHTFSDEQKPDSRWAVIYRTVPIVLEVDAAWLMRYGFGLSLKRVHTNPPGSCSSCGCPSMPSVRNADKPTVEELSDEC